MKALSGKAMWRLLFSAVIWHELACQPGELLSEEVDRAIARHPLLVYGYTAVTVAHLLNWLPPAIDPYSWAGRIANKYQKGTQ